MPRKPDPSEVRTIKLELRRSVWQDLEAMAKLRTANDRAAGMLKPQGRVTLTMIITEMVSKFMTGK